MIPNLLNTLIGLLLAYVAIFPHAIGGGRGWVLELGAAATVLLALWARPSNVLRWQATVTIVTGALLAVLVVIGHVVPVSDVLMFWSVLWAGLTSATMCLWALLYKPSPMTAAAG